MRSSSLLSRPTPTQSTSADDLLLLWQHPETRQIAPIGRFMRGVASYSFAYTRAAAEIEGFRPLLGLQDLHQRYSSDRIPAVFAQRVMDRDRPDFADYLGSIGLDPDHATPWEQIVHSGGMRAGDTLQFMQVPTVIDGRARARFLVNGIRHVAARTHLIGGSAVTVQSEEQEFALLNLTQGDLVTIEAEERNDHDPHACMVLAAGTPLGWVPRAISAGVRELLEFGFISATVVRVGPKGTPPHLRLVVDLDAEAPDTFRFDREGRWTPLADQ